LLLSKIFFTLEAKERNKKAQNITIKGLILNFILIILKLFAGFYGKSAAMLADAVHSISDIFSDFVVMSGMYLGAKPKDKNHHYGHGKIETLSTSILALFLFGAALYIFWSGFLQITNHINGAELEIPKKIALYMALISIIAKEIIYRYTLKVGKEINSKVLIANAWHHRSDALTSIGTFIGIGAAVLLGGKWAVLDPVAALIVSLFIFRLAYILLKDSIKELVETALPKHIEQEILQITMSVEGVITPHNLKTRNIGSVIAIDMHFYVVPDLNITEAHEISRLVENNLKKRFGNETIISLHIEPQASCPKI